MGARSHAYVWVLALAGILALTGGRSATAATLPPGFQENIVVSGLVEPTAVRFSPDGRVFVAEKSGIVKVFDSLSDPTPSIYADLRTQVHSYNDRGLLGLALDPSFPTVQTVYVSYSHDAAIGGTAPRWGSPGVGSDDCPTPPGPNIDGCVISARVSALSPGAPNAQEYRDAVLADTPAGYWRLGESSGVSAADASGNGRTGTYVSSPSLGQQGALDGDTNTSVSFDGTAEHVSVGYTAALNASAFTVEAWAYVTGGSGRYRAVVSSRDYATNAPRGFTLYATATDQWAFWVGPGSGGWSQAVGPAVQPNRWTHLVGTYNGSTARLFVDGVQVAEVASGFTPNSTRPMRIAAGANERAADYLFPGRVDEVAIFPSALASPRIQAHYDAATGAADLATERVLIEDWCQQFPTGSIGQIQFGADGALYVAGGSGGSFTFTDFGQAGSPLNPCGDPPGGVGGTQTAPTAEGGWLRSQDLRTSGDPAGLGGSVIRVDRITGAGFAGNPFASSPDANARRIIAYGLRNPYRMTFRPETNELWIGDVGAGTYEDLERVADGADSVAENFGWPCYEGPVRQGGYDAADLTICESLYSQPSAVTQPVFSYQHGQPFVSGETCPHSSGSSTSGLAFAPSAGGVYPASYNGALFLADYARTCIWVMFKNASGQPDPATRTPFAQGASYPVQLEFGPDGKLYYVDVALGTIRRIDYFASNQPPVAVATAAPTSGPAPLTVSFDGSGSSDADGSVTGYAWDLDGDGQFDDATAQKPTFQYTQAGTYTVRLRVTDNQGATGVSSPLPITVGSSPPVATIDTPAPTVTWRAGSTISFSGHGTDAEDGTLAASRLSWELVLRHCLSTSDCHSHVVQSFPGVAGGSFSTPDHDYPSYLELSLTATDSSGLTDRKTVRLDPRTVVLDMRSSPSGLTLVVNSETHTTPFTYTAIEGATTTISAASPQALGGTSYTFASWSDGGARTHIVTPGTNVTYTAAFTADPPATGYRDAVLADAPVGYWRLGESTGSVLADTSGAGRTGAYRGSPALGQPGALAGDPNTSVGFNGTSQDAQVPFAASLNPAQFSVEAWVYLTGGQGRNRSLVTSRDFAAKATRGYALYAGSEDTWQFWVGGGTGSWRKALGPAVTLNAWNHLVGTYDGTTARLYLNGALVGSTTSAFAVNAARPLRIASGVTEKAAQHFLPGRIDEVAVYPTALTPVRIQAHKNAASTGGGNQAPTAVASATPTSGPAPLTVAFSGSGSSDPDGTISSYAWDLDGDGQYDDSNAQSPSFQYPLAGTVTVRLRVTDNGGLTATSAPLTITATGTSPAPYRDAVLADGPVGYWRLGESAGSVLADASGAGRTGAYRGSPALGQLGALTGDANTAAGFNGTSQDAEVPFASALNPSQFTVEAWVYLTGGQGRYRSLVTSRDYATGNARGYTLYAAADDTWQFWVGSGTNDWGRAYGPAVTLNSWAHLVGTYDGTTARLYLNGALVGSGVSTFAINAARPLRIASGATDRAAEYYLPGLIDEVAVYPSALSPTRIQAHRTAATG